MSAYCDRLSEHLASYKAEHLPDVQTGNPGQAEQDLTLPRDQQHLNVLSGIRDRFWRWQSQEGSKISLHDDFSRLDSTQAMSFNLFFPFVDEKTGAVDSRLPTALGLRANVAYQGEFEKVFDPQEGTHFDFYLEGSGERRVFFELMLSENGSGGCEDDERLHRKLDAHYQPHLTDHVDAEWLKTPAFSKHYQILRHFSYLGRYPQSGLAFIFPRMNESFREDEETIKRIVSKSLAPRVAVLYLENVVARILTVVDGDRALTDHFLAFKEKYLVRPAA